MTISPSNVGRRRRTDSKIRNVFELERILDHILQHDHNAPSPFSGHADIKNKAMEILRGQKSNDEWMLKITIDLQERCSMIPEEDLKIVAAAYVAAGWDEVQCLKVPNDGFKIFQIFIFRFNFKNLLTE